MAKNINVLLSLVDKFSKPMDNVVAKTKDAQREMRLAQNQLKNFGSGVKDKISNVGSVLGSVATSMGAIGAGAFVVGGIQTFKEFDQSMKNLAATAGITADETNADYKSMMDKARELGASTSKTASEAANAMNYMKLAGWETADVLTNVDKVLMLSEASGMDLAQASDAVTDSMSALGLQTKDTARYLDVVAKAQQSSNMTAAMLMDAYKSVGGVMNSLNVPIEDSATALGVLANRGIKAAEGGNSLSAIMTNLTSGTGTAGKTLAALGLSAFDSQGKFKGLQQVFIELNEATKNMTQEERTATLAAIGGKEQLKTLNALMSGLTTKTKDGSTEWNALAQTLRKDADGSLKQMSTTMKGTLKGSMDSFNSALQNAQISLIQGFAPAMTDVLNLMASDVLPAFAGAFEWFANNVLPIAKDNMDLIIPAIAGVTAGLVAFKVISTVTALWGALTTAIAGAGGAMAVFNGIFALSPLGWIAAAIGAVVAVTILLWKNWDKVCSSVSKAIEWFGNNK